MKRIDQRINLTGIKPRIEQAEARTEQAETRTEQAKTRAEQAETRTEQAETRTEQAETRTALAKTRTELAEVRAEQAETRSELAEATLQRVVNRELDFHEEIPTQIIDTPPMDSITGQKSPLEQLTDRQREILQHIAEGRNTKQIAEILKVSPKTVEYHRMKLMDALNVHDIPGLVRLALRGGLIPPEI